MPIRINSKTSISQCVYHTNLYTGLKKTVKIIIYVMTCIKISMELCEMIS